MTALHAIPISISLAFRLVGFSSGSSRRHPATSGQRATGRPTSRRGDRCFPLLQENGTVFRRTGSFNGSVATTNSCLRLKF